MITIEPCWYCQTQGNNGDPDTFLDKNFRWFVECWNCEARGPHLLTEAEAIDAWNNRFSGAEQEQHEDHSNLI